MKELKITKVEKIELNNENYSKYNFLETKAIAILKTIDFLSKEGKTNLNPLEIIKQEFIIKYGTEKFNNTILYNISISCLIEVCKYLDNNLNLNIDDTCEYFTQRGDV